MVFRVQLEQLPPPPLGKTGWPWTEASQQIPDRIADGQPWPKMSIVTPSFNQGQYLEETIRSVLLQGYPNLEYIIIDGGSTDGSVDIIRKYEPWLIYWVSESDRGQAYAINKGFARATGDFIAWLNSDDLFKPGALNEASKYLIHHPDIWVVYGESDFIQPDGRLIGHFASQPFCPPQMFFDHFIPQPSTFIRRIALGTVGILDETLHFCMDYDLWLRIVLHERLDYVQQDWSCYRTHQESKSSRWQAKRWVETAQILTTFFARAGVPREWVKYRSQAIGQAHWHASIEYQRLYDADMARVQITQALRFAPEYIQTRGFAGRLIGSLADQTTEEILAFVTEYFALIPDAFPSKARAINLAFARAEALLALNSATSRERARHHGRAALRRDPRWLFNRHLVSRAFR